MKDILPAAHKARIGSGAFNAANFETAMAIIQAAEEEKSPVILQLYMRMFDSNKAKWLGGALIRMAKDCSQPVALHLDHGKSLEQVKHALEWGYTSVMLDGSNLPFDENVAITAEAARLAHAAGASCEGEIGHVAMGDQTAYTDPDEAAKFAAATGVDALAVSIGTVHGYYKAAPLIRADLCANIAAKIPDLPLVLHGGTGTPMADVQKVIREGITKINIATQFQDCYLPAMEAELKKLNGAFLPVDKFMDPPTDACVAHIRKLIRQFALKE
ncbi:MAG: class II fructose-bisphosphate aldolase [Victivallales bacterium]|nr:class II fructose-bisphosphate aldolase [Victivallales bacterium]